MATNNCNQRFNRPAQATVKAICKLHSSKCFHMVSIAGLSSYQQAEDMAARWLVAGIGSNQDSHQAARNSTPCKTSPSKPWVKNLGF